MSIDRRIVSILYHNGIFDIEDVEKFVGEKDNYYEIIIDGELKKLKIPGKEYVDEITTEFEYEEIEAEIEISFEDEMKKTDDENDIFLEKIKDDVFLEEIKEGEEEVLKYFNDVLERPSKMPFSDKDEVKEIFKQTDLEEIIKENKENKKLIVTKTEVKVTKPKTPKNVTIKKPDDEIDDFMNTI